MTKRSVRLSEVEAERIISSLRLRKGAATASAWGDAADPSKINLSATKAPKMGLQRWQGLGRLPVGQLNKTEAAYAALLAERLHDGEIKWFKPHAFNVRLANNTFYRVDFLVLASDGVLEIHEVKGGYTSEKGQMKIKMCAEVLPVFRMFKVSKIAGGAWKIEDFSS